MPRIFGDVTSGKQNNWSRHEIPIWDGTGKFVYGFDDGWAMRKGFRPTYYWQIWQWDSEDETFNLIEQSNKYCPNGQFLEDINAFSKKENNDLEIEVSIPQDHLDRVAMDLPIPE